jgi:hypothetical protein
MKTTLKNPRDKVRSHLWIGHVIHSCSDSNNGGRKPQMKRPVQLRHASHSLDTNEEPT